MKQQWVVVLLACLMVSSCAWRDRANDYRQVQLTKPITLPSGIRSDSMYDSYQVQGLESRVVLPGEFEVPKPDPLIKDTAQGVVRIQKMGDDRWILLGGTPGQVWPRLRGFLNLGGFPVARTDAVNGIIETGWVQPKAQDEKGNDLARERYRFHIVPGVQRATSEIYVLQSAVESADGSWPRDSFSEGREQEMSVALAQYLADTEAAGSVSMLAERNAEAGGRIFLVPGADSHIRLLLGFDRAWASLENALQKSGFVVEDRNRSEGRYWIKVADKDEKSARWFYRLAKDKDVQADSFYVEMKAVNQGEMEIRVSSQSGKGIGPDVIERMLKQIKGYIS